MPFETVKLLPGVKSELTPTLLEAGISDSNLIRFRANLPEKLGGWAKFYSGKMPEVVNEIWPWADLNNVNHLAVGFADDGLQVITGTQSQDISPRDLITNPTVQFSTVSGSNVITIKDVGSNASVYDGVFINTPVSVGGIIIYGSYAVVQSGGPDQYEILAADLATATVTNGGAVPVYTSAINTVNVNVLLNAHGYAVGDTYAAPVSVTVGGLVIQGLYTVRGVVDANNFTIDSQFLATSTQTVSMNGGDAQIIYYITPTQPQQGSGYGIGGYGEGGYGSGITPPPVTGNIIATNDWSLANWGSTLISSPEGFGVFTWSPDSGLRGSQIVVNAPTSCTGFFIAMPEQQIVVYGASVLGVLDPMLVAWCDTANYNVWTASVANQAGTYRLTRGSKIIGALQGPQQGLIWTDVGVWDMQYVGYPFVYGFNEIGQGCGLIAKKAAGVLGAAVYWMSLDGFWVYSGGAVQRLPCDVWDVVFQDINLAQAADIRCGPNTAFDEITWYFPSNSLGGTVNSRYVKFNQVLGVWDIGTLSVTAWRDANVYGAPISSMGAGTWAPGFNFGGGGYNPYIYQHEISPDADGSPMDSWFVTGLFMLSEGEDFVFIDYLIPDFKYVAYAKTNSAQMLLTLFSLNFPNDTPVNNGTYPTSTSVPAIAPRVRNRYFYMKIESNDLGSFWRLGGCKARFAPDGRNG